MTIKLCLSAQKKVANGKRKEREREREREKEQSKKKKKKKKKQADKHWLQNSFVDNNATIMVF